MDAVGFSERLSGADLVITGEGKLDEQSLRGKTVAGVVRAAKESGVRVAVVCGRAEIAPDGVRVASLVDRFGPGPAMQDTRRCLETLAQELAAEVDGDAAGAPGPGLSGESPGP
jgi:glycerate kinase